VSSITDKEKMGVGKGDLQLTRPSFFFIFDYNTQMEENGGMTESLSVEDRPGRLEKEEWKSEGLAF
jgi:hypothetical protein